ncbi:MAG: transposase [Ardenticatenales bacterium]
MAEQRNGAGERTMADTGVLARPRRRTFSAEYKLRILREVDACDVVGSVGALLRREGLYSSHLSDWRRQCDAGQLAALAPRKRGLKARPDAQRVIVLERENARLRLQLEQAETIIEVQTNLAGLLGQLPAYVVNRPRKRGRPIA